jgi:hypothetical protein
VRLFTVIGSFFYGALDEFYLDFTAAMTAVMEQIKKMNLIKCWN